MSKIIYVACRDSSQHAGLVSKVLEFLKRTTMDNDFRKHVEAYEIAPGRVIGGTNLGPEQLRGTAAYTGWMNRASMEWHQLGEVADGSFAAIRSTPDGKRVEALTDWAGSRQLFYAKTDDWFIVSSNQRAIPFFTQSFEESEEVKMWMLTAGSMGPHGGWDRRAMRMDPNSTVSFDFDSWMVIDTAKPVMFNPQPPHMKMREAVRSVLDYAIGSVQLPLGRTAIALSGGNDCRAILQRLNFEKSRSELLAITWGKPEASEDVKSDASIAKRLAKHHGLNWEYKPMVPPVEDPAETILQRFVDASGGGCDHIAGYMDGMTLWPELQKEGIEYLIRGDEPFGRAAVKRLEDVRPTVAMHLWRDWQNLPPAHTLGINVPTEGLTGCINDTIDMLRDRFVYEYKIPVILATLNEVKANYVDPLNPLLQGVVVDVARHLSDHDRTDKRLFRSTTKVDVPFAARPAVHGAEELFSLPGMMELLRKEVTSDSTRENFSPALSEYVEQKLRSAGKPLKKKSLVRRVARSLIPDGMYKRLFPAPVKRTLSPSKMALRIAIANRTLATLRSDAAYYKRRIVDDRTSVHS